MTLSTPPPSAEQTFSFTTDISDAQKKADNSKDEKCDYVFCTCSCYQLLDVRAAVVLHSMAIFVSSMFANGIVSGSLTTIERRFELSSVDLGLISVLADAGQLLLLLPISSLGIGRARKMRIESFGVLMIGVAGLMFSSPHFLSPPYQPESAAHSLCNGTASKQPHCGDRRKLSSLKNFRWAFWAAIFVYGMGNSSIYSLGTAYVDENSSLRKGYFYFALMNSNIFFGAALGNLLAGQFLKTYVDWTPPKNSTISSASRGVWLGAWWIGGLVVFVISSLLFLPLFGLPRHMPKFAQLQKEKKRPADLARRRHSFVRGLRRLLTNTVLLLLCVSLACEMLFFTGLGYFGPKYLEIAFAVAKTNAPVILGTCTVVSGVGGTILGGAITRWGNFDLRRNLLMLASVAFFNLLPLLGFLMGCPQTQALMSARAPCNRHCGCRVTPPMAMFGCGADQRTYFSPCFAGCSDQNATGFFNCRCVKHLAKAGLPEWRDGYCPVECGASLPAFVALLCLELFTTSVLVSPAINAVLGCVKDGLQSLALGLSGFASRLFGSIPGPLIFAFLIDASCSRWNVECGVRGSCLDYVRLTFRIHFLVLCLLCKFVSALALLLACLFQLRKERKEKMEKRKKNVVGHFDDRAASGEAEEL